MMYSKGKKRKRSKESPHLHVVTAPKKKTHIRIYTKYFIVGRVYEQVDVTQLRGNKNSCKEKQSE